MMGTQGLQHRRSRDVNFGDLSSWRGDKRAQLVSVSLDEASAMTFYASARVAASPELRPYVTVLATVEWGHGGTSITAEHQIGRRLVLPLAASMVNVEARLVDLRNGSAPGDNVSADVRAFLAHGPVDARVHHARAVVRYGAAGELARGPQDLLALRGYASPGSSAGFLMLFDGEAAPTDGAVPALATALAGGGAAFTFEPSSPRVFLAGVWWSVSRTPDVLTRDPAPVHLEAELAP